MTRAVAGLSQLACELGGDLAALDVNPLICGPHGAVAVDALGYPGHPVAIASSGQAGIAKSGATRWVVSGRFRREHRQLRASAGAADSPATTWAQWRSRPGQPGR